ncbi:MAG: 2-isopropylmalate synthase, partial [Selenomonadales bacterium]|nr:2-isopropylmalate synthase [Selenomonadales bacterium]
GIAYGNLTYAEHAMEQGQQTSSAVAYVSVQATDGDVVWGVGIDTDITTASIHALVSAVNRLATK